MRVRHLVLAGGLLVVAMLAVSAWAWPQIPAGSQIPIHWGPDGVADGFGPRWLGLLGLPLTAIGLLALLAFLPRIEPRRQNLERSAKAYVGVGLGVIAFLAVLHVFVVRAALGSGVDVAGVALIGAGVLFAVIGNYLGKTRSNWFFGIRTPWTLSSDIAWARTHRLGGVLFVALGIITLVSAITLPSEVALWVMLGGLSITITIVVVYSYRVWRLDPARRAAGTGPRTGE